MDVGSSAHAHRRHHDDAREHDDVRARVRHDDVDDRPRDQPELVATALADVRADHPLLQPRLQPHETPRPEAVRVHAYQHDDDQHDDDARMRGLAHLQEALRSRGDDGHLGGDARHKPRGEVGEEAAHERVEFTHAVTGQRRRQPGIHARHIPQPVVADAHVQ